MDTLVTLYKRRCGDGSMKYSFERRLGDKPAYRIIVPGTAKVNQRRLEWLRPDCEIPTVAGAYAYELVFYRAHCERLGARIERLA